MQQRGAIPGAPVIHSLRAPADSDRSLRILRGQSGETMRLDTVDYGSSQSDERKSETKNDETQGQLTPARRAALDALEREFDDLLNARRRSRVA